MTITYRDQISRDLTPAEVDANFRHVLDSTNSTFAQSGSGAVSESVQNVIRRKWKDVQSYGAVGDNATDDSAAIIAAAVAAGVGGTVYFPKATKYFIGTTSVLMLEGQTWVGEGQDASEVGSVLRYTGSGNAIESSTRATSRIFHNKIVDLGVIGNAKVAGSCGIDLRRVDRIRCERVYVEAFDIGIRCDGTGTGGFRNTFTDCDVIGNNTGYQAVTAANEQLIIGGRCTNNTDFGLDVQGGNSIIALGVNWESNGVNVKTADANTRILGGRMEAGTTYRWQTTAAASYFWIEGVHLSSTSKAYLDEGDFSNIKEIDRNAVRGMNLIRNGGMEVWSAGTTSAPDRWSLSNCTAARDTDMQEGSYSALLTNTGSASAALLQDFAIPTAWRDGRREYLCVARVKLGTSTHAALAPSPQDGGGSTQGSILAPDRSSVSRVDVTTAGWQTVYAVARPNSSATRIRVLLNPDRNNLGGTAFFDAVCLMPLGGWHEEFYEHDRDLAPKLERILVSSKTHDFDATDGGTTTLTVPGAASGDDVLVTAPFDTADVNVKGYVSGADTVTIVKIGGGNPGSATYGVLVFKR